MPTERRPFSLIGRTTGEKVRNVVGLVLILGFLGWRYIDVKVERVSAVDISAADYGIRTPEDLQASIQAFQPSERTLLSVANAIQVTAEEIKKNVVLSFVFNHKSPPTLRVECTSDWPKTKVVSVCEAIASDLKHHLQTLKKPS